MLGTSFRQILLGTPKYHTTEYRRASTYIFKKNCLFRFGGEEAAAHFNKIWVSTEQK